MNKFLQKLRIATITLWPLLFLLSSNMLGRNLIVRSSLDFDPRWRFLIFPIYLLAGLLFAFIATGKKSRQGEKG